jgi:hypothetical protein
MEIRDAAAAEQVVLKREQEGRLSAWGIRDGRWR